MKTEESPATAYQARRSYRRSSPLGDHHGGAGAGDGIDELEDHGVVPAEGKPEAAIFCLSAAKNFLVSSGGATSWTAAS